MTCCAPDAASTATTRTPLSRGSKVCSTCSIMRPSRLRSRDESQLNEVTSGSPKLYSDCSSSWNSPSTASGVRREFNNHSRSRRSETFNCRTDWARVGGFSELLAGSRSISLSSNDCVTVCSGSHRAISFQCTALYAPASGRWQAEACPTVVGGAGGFVCELHCFAALPFPIFLSSLSRNVHRLQRVQAAYPRVQFLTLFGAVAGLGQTAVQQSQRLRQLLRRLPIFQLVAFDLGSQRLQNRHRDVFMPGPDAELRALHLAVEACAAVALVRDLAHQHFDSLLRPAVAGCLHGQVVGVGRRLRARFGGAFGFGIGLVWRRRVIRSGGRRGRPHRLLQPSLRLGVGRWSIVHHGQFRELRIVRQQSTHARDHRAADRFVVIAQLVTGAAGIALQIQPAAAALQGHALLGRLQHLRPVALHGEALEILSKIRRRGGKQCLVDVRAGGAQFAPPQAAQQQVGRGVVLVFAAQELGGRHHARDGVVAVYWLGRQRSAGLPGPRRRRARPLRCRRFFLRGPRCGLRLRLLPRHRLVWLLLALLLQENTDRLLYFLQRLAQRPKTGSHILELLFAESIQSQQRFQRAVEVRRQLHVVRLGRAVEALVELLGRQFAVGDRRSTRFRLDRRFPGFLFRGNLARLLVDEPAIAAAGEWRVLYAPVEPAPDPIQRSRAQLQIAILDIRIECVPKAFDQALEQVQSVAQPANALRLQQGFGQPRRQLQILALGGQGLADGLHDERPVGDLAFDLPVALRGVVVFPASFLDLVEYRSVPEILTARVFSGYGVQQVIP